MSNPKYRLILDFDGSRPVQEAVDWATAELQQLLPDSTVITLEVEELFATVDDLPSYIGNWVTVNKGTMFERAGRLEQVLPMNLSKSIVVIEGSAVEVRNWDIIYINENGDYTNEHNGEEIPRAGAGGNAGYEEFYAGIGAVPAGAADASGDAGEDRPADL